MHSDAGSLLDRVLELEWSIDKFHLTWDDVSAEESKALQILIEEREKHKLEEQEKDRQEQQMRGQLSR